MQRLHLVFVGKAKHEKGKTKMGTGEQTKTRFFSQIIARKNHHRHVIKRTNSEMSFMSRTSLFNVENIRNIFLPKNCFLFFVFSSRQFCQVDDGADSTAKK
jgi:hypothetical protein